LTIDVSIEFKIPVTDLIHLKDTIDYTTIYQAIESEMNKDHQLLESIAIILINSIKKCDERIQHCKVRVSKKPQLGRPLDQVAVELEY
jgi:dihydroneopterin aldolase